MTHGGLWGEATNEEAAPGALESAMRIPGAVAAAFGDVGSGRVLGSTSRPARTGGVPVPFGNVALGIAMSAVADFADFGGNPNTDGPDTTENGQAVEEVIVTGSRYFSLWQAARMRSGEWHAFIQISLDRTQANLAMARLDLRAVAECLPGAVEYHRYLDTASRAPAPVAQRADPAPPAPPAAPTAAAAAPPAPPAATHEPPHEAPDEDGEELPRRNPGRQIPGSVPAARAKQVSESTLRQILWGLRRYR
ncbi:hypothetical protein [Streptacidiphilus melanogenes]|uniref:hypothetical protein n=1 Tax=Streptacidiphilus melanogenes TaxID=411235 RepID=UPI0005AAD7AE|nr:hypothetical protein [Streptacidiphilus melanogenes]